MTNHNQDRDHLSPEFTADTQTPHSGSEHVSEEMRDFHRTGEFDRSRLQDVANERTAGGEEILTVPDSPASNPDALKDLYDMPAVIPPKEHRDDKNTGKGKKIGLIAGGLAAGAGILGVGIVVGSASSESDTATPATVAAPEAPVVSDNILDTPPSETVITVEAVPVETTPLAPETTNTTSEDTLAESQPGIIQPIDIEGLTADLTSEIDQEAFEEMLASASEVATYGYNNNSIEHVVLTIDNPAAIKTAKEGLDAVNNIKETQISHYKYGYRMEAQGAYTIEADGSIVADVEEFQNTRGAIRSNEWVSLGMYTMNFRLIETPVQMEDGTVSQVPVWKFVRTVS